jgi:hypothetical protein
MTLRTEKDPEPPLVADRTAMHRVAKDRATITFSLSSADHTDLVALLHETDARISFSEMCTALTGRSTGGEIRMPAGRAAELLEWLRGRARAGRASSTTAELERALLLGRVALAVQRALAKLGSTS